MNVRVAMALDNEDKPRLVAALLQLFRTYVLADLPSLALDVKSSFACSRRRGATQSLPIDGS